MNTCLLLCASLWSWIFLLTHSRRDRLCFAFDQFPSWNFQAWGHDGYNRARAKTFKDSSRKHFPGIKTLVQIKVSSNSILRNWLHKDPFFIYCPPSDLPPWKRAVHLKKIKPQVSTFNWRSRQNFLILHMKRSEIFLIHFNSDRAGKQTLHYLFQSHFPKDR